MRGVCAFALTLAACRFDVDRLTSGGDGAGVVDAPGGGGDAAPADAPPTCLPPANDLGDRPTDVSGGGAFCNFLGGANDDHVALCGSMVGRDLFYELVLPAPEAVYVDTFGSSRPVAVTMHPSPCDPLLPDVSCAPPTCGGQGAQFVWDLAAGTYCLTADEDGLGGPDDYVVLNLVRLDAPGAYLSPVLDLQDTCVQPNSWTEAIACGGPTPGGDYSYVFTLCPGEATMVGARVTSCAPSTREVILSLRSGRANTAFIACDRGFCSATPPVDLLPIDLVGPPYVYWFVIDSLGAGDCGPATTTVEFTF